MSSARLSITGAQMPPAPSTGARAYFLAALASISMTSWADRAAFNLLAEPIRQDLQLSDTEIGLIGGLAFAALYALLSIPIARLAERKSRLAIMVGAVSLWSVMTMLCAACSNFWQLAVARAGCGVGESACLPCSQSMISDTYPPDRRATAISVFTLGVPVGTALGIIVGAWVAETYSWRIAFIVVGAPGLLLAILAAFTLKEPFRGRFDPPTSDIPPSLAHVVRHLWAQPAFPHLLAGAATATMLCAGLGAFLTPLMLRGSLGLTLTDMAFIGVFLVSVGTFVGALAGGTQADRLAKRDPRWTLWLPALAFAVGAPAWTAAFLSNSVAGFVFFALIGQIAISIFIAPLFGVLANMVEPRMRATAVAVMGVVNSLVGLGLGPVLVGTFSDFAARSFYGVSAADCAAAASTACAHGSYLGLRASLVATALLFLWPAFHFLRAGSRLTEGSIAIADSRPIPSNT
mgnify:CR=1 FL=1